MLRITESESSAAAKSYFGGSLRRGDYYLEGQEIAGNWGGKAAKMLGLSGPVKEAEFCAMLENIRPDGHRLTVRTVANRRPGYDFTFDVPKSVSLVHAIGGDTRIVAAMKKALDETMVEIEMEMHTRVRKNGAQEDRRTGNMVWADFTHFTSRPAPLDEEQARSIGDDKMLLPDPHLHVHVYALNATWDTEESQWKAGVFMQAKRDATYFQAAYHARLASELQKLGYTINPTARAFELAGVPRELIEAFSRRTKEVEDAAEELGITDAKARDKLGAKTRHAKDKSLSQGQLRRSWEKMAGPDEVARLKEVAKRARETTGAFAIDDMSKAKEGVEYALEKELSRSSETSERRVLAAALEKSVGTASVASVATALEKRDGVLRATIDDEKRLTTMAILKEESALLKVIREAKGTVAHLWRGAYRFTNPLFLEATAQEQRMAVEKIMASQDWVMGLIGRAGTGKTTLLKEIEAGLRAVGVKLITVAPTAEASRGVLRQEGFASADTVQRLLVDHEQQKILRGNVLWIDEAGMLGNHDMMKLLAVAKANGVRKIVFAGDPTQIRSVPRGDALRFLEEHAGLAVARLQTIMRQKNPVLRKAVEAISQAEIQRGLSLIDGEKCIVEATTKGAHAALARAYAERVPMAKASVLVVCPTHAEGDKITKDIRRELKATGQLGNDECKVMQTVNLGLTEPEKSRAASYDMGMVVQFRNNVHDFARSERVRVVKVDARDGHVRVLKNDGRTMELPLGKPDRFDVYRLSELPVSVGERLRITQNSIEHGHRFNNGDSVRVKSVVPDGSLRLDTGAVLPAHFGHLTHGYVSTADAAQSKTVDSVLIGIGRDSMGAADMRRVYVAVSRARHEARIYTDDKEGLYVAASRDTVRRFGMELLGFERAQQIVQEDLLREIEQRRIAEKERTIQPHSIDRFTHNHPMSKTPEIEMEI
jgi:conjugative relaxase-like TrwC/TraI family protein